MPIIAPKWNKQSKNNRRIKIKAARLMLTRFSGNDVCAILVDVLEKSEIETLAHKYIKALKGIAAAVKETIKIKNKHHFIRPLRLAGLKFAEVKQLGFEVGTFLWQSCLDDSDRHLGGQPATSKEIVEEITTFMETITTEAANRPVLIKSYSEKDQNNMKTITGERIETARCLQTSISEAYRQYLQLESQHKKISQNTFSVYVDKRIFKKPIKYGSL
jgi:hypothetical protein